MKKFLSVILSLVIMLSVTGVSAFAATSSVPGIEKPRRVRISASQMWVRVNESIQLDAVITPDDFQYDRIVWRTLDYDIVSVDNNGEVTGLKLGTAVIEAAVYVGQVKVGSADIKIEVSSAIKKPNRVRIEASQKWVRTGRSIQLDAVVLPDTYNYDSIEWYTLDYDLVSVDDYGELTGLRPGIANIAVYVYVDGPTRRYEVGSAEIEIEVRESTTSSYFFDDSKYDPDVPRVSSLSKGTARKGIIPTKTVNEAVKKALVAGTTTSTTFKNYTSISTVSLESAAADMQLGGGGVLLNFDTLALDGKTTDGRLTINPRAYKRVKYNDPLQVGHSINVLVNTNNADVLKVREQFQKFYKNDILVIKAGQEGGYGMNVTCTVNAGNIFSKAKQANLKLYTYDPNKGKSGTFRMLKNPNISIDGDKNLQFTTDTGNYLIISNGALAKK